MPVAGRPGFLRITDIDFDIIPYNVKASRGEGKRASTTNHCALCPHAAREIAPAMARRDGFFWADNFVTVAELTPRYLRAAL